MKTHPDEAFENLTAREYAAIHLRVPSGTKWLDEMVDSSLMISASVSASAGLLARKEYVSSDDLAEEALECGSTVIIKAT